MRAVIRQNLSDEDEKKLLAILPKSEISTKHLALFCEPLRNAIEKAVEEELEIYRKIPKRNSRFNIDEFDPTNNEQCFMGQAFDFNGQGQFEDWYDYELELYRNKVGTISHKKWGKCTLLEAWAADHFKSYPDMVKAAFKYGNKKTKRKPQIAVFIVSIFGFDCGKL